MDLHIEAPGHPRQEQLRAYYEEKLIAAYQQYPFIKNVEVKVTTPELKAYTVSIMMKPEGGTMLFAKHVDANEQKALTEAIQKMNGQLERYKEQRYHSAHKVARK